MGRAAGRSRLVVLGLAGVDMALLVDHLGDLGAAHADEADALGEGEVGVGLAPFVHGGGDGQEEDDVVPLNLGPFARHLGAATGERDRALGTHFRGPRLAEERLANLRGRGPVWATVRRLLCVGRGLRLWGQDA